MGEAFALISTRSSFFRIALISFLYFYSADVNTESPDKKSVMMYVMCLFQALPRSDISVENFNVPSSHESSPAPQVTYFVTQVTYFVLLLQHSYFCLQLYI